ncbi:hypothetical protein [Pseudoduganella sp. OTU4001]|uniref:hypothetical protein n=1 Tax=Pseudoduganella sp. OTU4001 TaxID=3043854 RepID=UPI00313AD433
MEGKSDGVFVPLNMAQRESLERFAAEFGMPVGDFLRSAAECMFFLERNEVLSRALSKARGVSDDAEWQRSMEEIDASQKRVWDMLNSHPVK